MPAQRLRQADLAAQLVEQDAAGGEPLAQRAELAFQPLRGLRLFGPQAHRQPRLAQLQFALHRTQRRQVQCEAERPAGAAVGEIGGELQLELQHIAPVLSLQRDLDHPGRQRAGAGLQLGHLHPRQRRLHVAMQAIQQRVHGVVGGRQRQRQARLCLHATLQQRRRGIAAVRRRRCRGTPVEQAGQAQQRTFPVVFGQRRQIAMRAGQPGLEEQSAALDGFAQTFAAGDFRGSAQRLLEQGQRRAQLRRQLAQYRPLGQRTQRGQQGCIAVLLGQALAQDALERRIGGKRQHLELRLRAQAQYADLELCRQLAARHVRFHGEGADLQDQQALRAHAQGPCRQHGADAPAWRGGAGGGTGPGEGGQAGRLDDQVGSCTRAPCARMGSS